MVNLPIHGGPDSDGATELDFSTCVFPFGPCPSAWKRVILADRSVYPDPTYTDLRIRIGKAAGINPDDVVPGSGGAELIHRLIRLRPGDVVCSPPTFGEYAHAADCAGRACRMVSDLDDFDQSVPTKGTLWVCIPNNPDGRLPTCDLLNRLDRACRDKQSLLVVDLAYYPYLLERMRLPDGICRLHVPNKWLGMPGVRGAWAEVPGEGKTARALAPSWVLGAEGVALLEASINPDSLHRFQSLLQPAHCLRGHLAQVLTRSGWEIRTTPALHLLARPADGSDPSKTVAELRSRGVLIRDTTSLGLAGWTRWGVRPADEIARLERILDRL